MLSTTLNVSICTFDRSQYVSKVSDAGIGWCRKKWQWWGDFAVKERVASMKSLCCLRGGQLPLPSMRFSPTFTFFEDPSTNVVMLMCPQCQTLEKPLSTWKSCDGTPCQTSPLSMLAKHEDDMWGTKMWVSCGRKLLCPFYVWLQLKSSFWILSIPFLELVLLWCNWNSFTEFWLFLKISPERGMVVLRAKMVEISAFWLLWVWEILHCGLVL